MPNRRHWSSEANQGEDRLVARVKSSATGEKASGLRVGIGDDAAIWRPRPGRETVLTCDWFLEGIHFIRDWHPADAVGWKCLARAVSDVAAMGGEARCFLLSVAAPRELTGKWLDEFLEGLRRAAGQLRCALAGGDTTRSDKALVSVTVIGEVRQGRALLRSGAQPGDAVFVSGCLGEAEAGLRLLRRSGGAADQADPRLRKHLYPEPRQALGQWLSKRRLATAAMDLSDGLSTDLGRLCEASGTGARIEAGRLPAAPGAPKGNLELALHGGDDYELLFTVPPGKADEIPRAYRGVPLTRIGGITKGRKVLLVGESGTASRLRPGGWDPFTGRTRRRLQH